MPEKSSVIYLAVQPFRRWVPRDFNVVKWRTKLSSILSQGNLQRKWTEERRGNREKYA